MRLAFDSLRVMISGEVKRRKAEFNVETDEPTDYVSSYLKEMHDQQKHSEFFSEENLISNCSEFSDGSHESK